jgi:hypothetical protein
MRFKHGIGGVLFRLWKVTGVMEISKGTGVMEISKGEEMDNIGQRD